jgi:choline dehydrogenase-like flavoprotein
MGETIPNPSTYCELDSSVVDKWGIPVLRFHWRSGENEIKMAKAMRETFRAIVEEAGGTYSTETNPAGPSPYGLYDGGASRVGYCADGDSPKTSVLNKYCRAYDVRNLFVTDSGALPAPTRIQPSPSQLFPGGRQNTSWIKLRNETCKVGLNNPSTLMAVGYTHHGAAG